MKSDLDLNISNSIKLTAHTEYISEMETIKLEEKKSLLLAGEVRQRQIVIKSICKQWMYVVGNRTQKAQLCSCWIKRSGTSYKICVWG